MNIGKKGVLGILLTAIVLGAAASLAFTTGNGVEHNLFALIGTGAESSPRNASVHAMAAMTSSAAFLVKADSQDAARMRLSELGVELPPSDRIGPLKALAPYARGFLSPGTRSMLERGDFAAVRDAAVARLFSPLPPVLPPDKDPFMLFTDYVLESSPTGAWASIMTELTPEQAYVALAAVKGASDVRCSGAPFHTAVASERSKREINALSGISLACVVLFGWLLTRSLRFLPMLAAMLAAAFCVATAVLFAAFPQPHLMTFVFGTTLIGLSVDYVYHALTAKEPITKPLTFSFLSTAACFAPLFFSGIGVLNQMALFTVTGLATVYAGVLAFGTAAHRTQSVKCGMADEKAKERTKCSSFFRLGAYAILVLSIAGICRMRFDNDLSRYHKPDAYLAEGEKIAAAMSGNEGFIPSAATQRHNAELVRRLYAAEGSNYCEMTGLPPTVLALPTQDPTFDPKGELENVFDRLTLNLRSILLFMAFLSLLNAIAALLIARSRFRGRSGMVSCFQSASLAALATVGLLGWLGEPITFFNLLCVFIFFGLGLDYAIFIWHDKRQQATAKAVRYSFLTSVVGFGLLGFTEFAVTRSMGITLAIGLTFSYFTAKLFCGGGCDDQSVPATASGDQRSITDWHEQREQCASAFWAQFMWYSYAWFGKAFQKAIFVIGMPVIYIFSRQARMSLSRFYAALSEHTGKPYPATHWRLFRHILGFAWGLMDKTDACTLKKNLPTMSVRDDESWRMFRELVDSGKGMFLLCTHVGVIGVLPALPSATGKFNVPKVHAFQQMGHDAVFMKVFMKHFDNSVLELHAVEDIGVETAVEMQEAIGRGEIVIMAGDRTSAGSRSVVRHMFLGKSCAWPKGAFKFARLMESPVFGVTCICTGWNRYEVHISALNRESLLEDYVTFLESETMAWPEQWYQFYDFFGEKE